jgi:hypothetical protein
MVPQAQLPVALPRPSQEALCAPANLQRRLHTRGALVSCAALACRVRSGGPARLTRPCFAARVPLLRRQIAAGLTTGALGIIVASPTDLVKVRRGAAAQARLDACLWAHTAAYSPVRRQPDGTLRPYAQLTTTQVCVAHAARAWQSAQPTRCVLRPALAVHFQVRMQSEGKLPAGAPRKYASAFAAYGIIARCALGRGPLLAWRRVQHPAHVPMRVFGPRMKVEEHVAACKRVHRQ